MSEKTQRRRVILGLKGLDPVAVENPAYPGTPDVNYTVGWIELKWLRRWPTNCDKSPVLVHHFTPQQRVWLRKRVRAGGRAYLLLQVGQEWLLFRGDVAALNLGTSTRPELKELAMKYWPKGLKNEELKQCLLLPMVS